MFNGGDITEIACKHPTLGSFVFHPKSAEDFTLDPGGYLNSDDQNMVTGDGQIIRQKNRKVWSMEGIVAWDMDTNETVHKLQDLANNPGESEWTFTHINGTSWGGNGSPVGDIQGNTNTSQITLKVNGGGQLLKINF